MSTKLRCPSEELKQIIVKYGISERYFTSFSGANLSFNPNDFIRSDFEEDTLNLLREFTEADDQYNKLVSWLAHSDVVSHVYTFSDYFGMTGVSAYIRMDAKEGVFDLTFVFPKIDAAKFSTDVAILSRISTFWASVAQMPISKIRVFIHHSFLRWETMEEEELLYPLEYESN
jgi:hypothetical protein